MSVPLWVFFACTGAILGLFTLMYWLVAVAERIAGWWNTRQMVASDTREVRTR